MAATAAARLLTATQRQQQLALRAATITDLLELWPILEPTAIDETSPRWMTATRALIGERRRTSEGLASRYLSAFKSAELGRPATVALRTAPLIAEQLDTSLRVTGPIALKVLIGRGISPVQAHRAASTQMIGSATRHVLNGGRSAIVGSVAADRDALGWHRVTGASPCAFCAMLASRGPVFKRQRSAAFDAHDHCSCMTEPVYRADSAWPGRNRQYRDLWNESTQGRNGTDALNAFRQALA